MSAGCPDCRHEPHPNKACTAHWCDCGEVRPKAAMCGCHRLHRYDPKTGKHVVVENVYCADHMPSRVVRVNGAVASNVGHYVDVGAFEEMFGDSVLLHGLDPVIPTPRHYIDILRDKLVRHGLQPIPPLKP
jgi:hypothetical protein